MSERTLGALIVWALGAVGALLVIAYNLFYGLSNVTINSVSLSSFLVGWLVGGILALATNE